MSIIIDESKLKSVGQNTQACIDDGKLIIVVDTTAKTWPSGTGKMQMFGGTPGYFWFENGMGLNMQVGWGRRSQR